MHYSIQLNAGGNTCYLVDRAGDYAVTIKPRNATTFDTYRDAVEVHKRVMDLGPETLRELLRRDDNFVQPVQVNVKSWRNGDTAPLTVRSKLYTFQLQD